MKVLSFAASNSKNSINKQLIEYAMTLIDFTDTEYLDINDYELPIYSPEREDEFKFDINKLALAEKFYAKISAADALIIAFAEHNGAYTAAYKNIFDWVSRINAKVYQNKPVIMLAASPGPNGANNVLNIASSAAPYHGAVLKGSLSIPNFYDVFNFETKKLTNKSLDAQLKSLLKTLTSR